MISLSNHEPFLLVWGTMAPIMMKMYVLADGKDCILWLKNLWNPPQHRLKEVLMMSSVKTIMKPLLQHRLKILKKILLESWWRIKIIHCRDCSIYDPLSMTFIMQTKANFSNYLLYHFSPYYTALHPVWRRYTHICCRV